MNSYIQIYIVIMITLILIRSYDGKSKTKLQDVRLAQINRRVKQTVLLQYLDRSLQKKIKPSKRISIEKELIRSGFNMDFLDFIMTSIISGLVSALIFGVAFSSFLVALAFLAIGTLLPYQVVGFVKNKRLQQMEKQVGSFLKMTISRYKNINDFNKVLRLVEKEFRGEEPIHSEIQKTIRDIDVSIPVDEALERMADRMNNKYMRIFASYYKITAEVGTEEAKETILSQALIQYEENYRIKRELKKEISGPKQEAYIMIGSIPAFAVYQMFTNDTYLDFMTSTLMGKIGSTVILLAVILVTWFVNVKIGAPLD